jgi:hypothetical protein
MFSGSGNTDNDGCSGGGGLEVSTIEYKNAKRRKTAIIAIIVLDRRLEILRLGNSDICGFCEISTVLTLACLILRKKKKDSTLITKGTITTASIF